MNTTEILGFIIPIPPEKVTADYLRTFKQLMREEVTAMTGVKPHRNPRSSKWFPESDSDFLDRAVMFHVMQVNRLPMDVTAELHQRVLSRAEAQLWLPFTPNPPPPPCAAPRSP
jgi:hypothetical protein